MTVSRIPNNTYECMKECHSRQRQLHTSGQTYLHAGVHCLTGEMWPGFQLQLSWLGAIIQWISHTNCPISQLPLWPFCVHLIDFFASIFRKCVAIVFSLFFLFLWIYVFLVNVLFNVIFSMVWGRNKIKRMYLSII